MKFSSISIYLIAFCLGSLAGNSFGELFMIRQTPQRTGDPYKLTCVSKDRDAAFVWNDDLRSPVEPKNIVPMQPRIAKNYTSPRRNDSIVIWQENSAWREVNSATNPMNPVFDSRWEDFSQFSFPRDDFKNEYQYVRNVSKSGTLIFSARGLGDINIRLCEQNKLVSTNPCFWITVPAWPNTTCAIRSCLWGKTEDRQLSQDLCNGEESVLELSSPSVIDASEWRTFALKWDTDYSQLKTYSGIKRNFINYFQIPKNVNHLFVQSSVAGHIRFHFYNYLLTRQNNVTLSSVPFLYGDLNYRIELLVSLCVECELQVHVIITSDEKSRTKIRSISGNQNFVDNELPTWQIVELGSIPREFYGRYVTLEIVPISKSPSVQCWWAIDSLPKYRPVGYIKTSTRTFDGLSNPTSSALPIVSCQQLSYSRNVVISSNASITQKISIRLPDCTSGRVGPGCIFSCTNSCKGTSICDQSDCICAPGIMGSNCSTECNDGRHGYNCQMICGSCKFGYCDKMTGICDSNCKDYYLPPYCKIEVKAPEVSNVTATTAILHYPRLNMETVERISIHIKTKTGPWQTFPAHLTRLGTPRVIPYRNLLPGTLYILRAVVTTRRGFVVNSPEMNFTTMCKLPIIPADLKLIDKGNGVVQLIYKNPSDSKWSITAFVVWVKQLSTSLRHKQLLNLPYGKFYLVQQLPSYYYVTLYLSASTNYHLWVQAMNSCGYSQLQFYMHFRVPASLRFASNEKLQVKQNESSISIKLPSVINDTVESVMTVVVKGHPSPTCTSFPVPDDLRNRINMTEFEDGWIADVFDGRRNMSECLTISKYTNDDSSTKCLLDPDQTYVIVVDVIDKLESKSAVITSLPIYITSVEAGKSNLVWLVLPLILLFFLLSLFIWRRKFSNALTPVHRQNVVLCWQIFTNFVKSTITCTSQQPPTFPLSAEVELSENIRRSDHVSWNPHPHSVNIEGFEDYVKASIASGLLRSQFQMFPRGKNRPCKYGALPENKLKNRYTDIIAYDNSRVVLKKTPDDPYSDYINANYIQGFRNKKAYIATQGPKPQTVVDFWRMVWQEEALIICMLTNVIEGPKVKCEQYWPDFGSSKTYGDIIVMTENHHVYSDYIVRIFQVSCKEESRKIVHMHYTGWPDHAVPMYPNPVISYLKKLQTTPSGKGPIIMHCSAGVGRTGAMILCDICLRRALVEGTIDVLADFKKLRDCRLNMVDTEPQYIFVHVVLGECFGSPLTDLECNSNLPEAMNELKQKLPQHIERLRHTTWQDQALHPQVSSGFPFPTQLAKNRFPELTPVSNSRIYLKRYPTHDSNSDYISAVIVDGLGSKKQYLASQLPLPSTLSDFWRLIAEQEIELVILLQQPDSKDPTCCDIIPVENPFNPVPFINVELKTNTNQETSPHIIESMLTDTSGVVARTQQVTFLTCPGWGLGRNGKPPPPDKLIELWMSSKNIRRETGPTLVLCHDGITGCGLYLALSFLLERMDLERKCDIIFAVRAIRQSRQNFVQSQEQFEYLCDAAVKYTEFLEM